MHKGDNQNAYQSTELARNERHTRLEAKSTEVPMYFLANCCHNAFLNDQNITFTTGYFLLILLSQKGRKICRLFLCTYQAIFHDFLVYYAPIQSQLL